MPPLLIAAGGTVAGIALGALSRTAAEFSLISGSSVDCESFNHLPWLGLLNRFRERQFQGLLLQHLPLPLTLFTSFFAIWNAYENEEIGHRRELNTDKLESNLLKFSAYPMLRHLTSALFVGLTRQILQRPLEYFYQFDVSGHAAYQMLYLMQVYQFLEALSLKGSSREVLAASTPLALLSLVELPWMYNTAANCHSVADMAIGAAIGLLAPIAVKNGAPLTFKWGIMHMTSRKIKIA